MSSSPVRISVIIPAAGLGLRFLKEAVGRLSSKLYSELGGKPLLAHVISAFDGLSGVKEIIVPLSEDGTAQFKKEILSRFRFKTPVVLVQGGKTRAESVLNGLKRVSRSAAYVCIHDGARPLIQADWLIE